MKKILFYFNLIILILTLTSCRVNSEYYFNETINKYNIGHLKYDNVIYFYRHTSGWDSIGINYYVLKFTEYPNDFFEQFYSPKFKEFSYYHFESVKNSQFENQITEELNKYKGIHPNMKPNFEADYIYNNFSMIYFDEIETLFIVEILK